VGAAGEAAEGPGEKTRLCGLSTLYCAIMCSMNNVRMSFLNRRGQELSGYLDLPADRRADGYAVLAHCFTCGKDLKPLANVSRAITGEGLAVLRFDFSGLGGSEGDFAESTLSTNVDDLVDAAGFIGVNYGEPRLLIGHSLGGVAALRAARMVESVRAVVTVATPASPAQLGGRLGRAREEAMEKGEGSIVVGGRPFSLRKSFFEDLESVDMEDVIRGLGRALLVLHSPEDRMVAIENASAIFRSARHPKSFVALGGADHLLLEEKDALYAGRVIGAWVSCYL
jgi:pimeloyl-ACP methyl ester carboxylesterase